jgi:CheY-like chemotaxis protein
MPQESCIGSELQLTSMQEVGHFIFPLKLARMDRQSESTTGRQEKGSFTYKHIDTIRPVNAQSSPKRILVVEDDYDIGVTYQAALESKGYVVDLYVDPKQALLEFRPKVYHLLLSDIRMPGITGFELYERLRKLDVSLKVCFITAFESYYRALTEFFPRIDVKCFLQKPMAICELLDHISEELDDNSSD